MVRRTRLNKGGRVTASCVQKTPGGTAQLGSKRNAGRGQLFGTAVRAPAAEQAAAPPEVHGPPPVICAQKHPPALPSADPPPLRRNRVAALPSAAGSGEGPPERKAWPPPRVKPISPAVMSTCRSRSGVSA